MASDIFTKHICTYCQEEIKSLRVKCVECADFELCLQCFSAGAEIGPHKKDHSYQFIDSVVCDVFRDRSGWSAREELYLLNAIEHFSYGNWEDISQHIGTRGPEEVRDEYISRYLGGDIGRHTWVPGLKSKCKLTDLTVNLEDDPPADPDLPSTSETEQASFDIFPEYAQQLDYMPLRDEYEEEYDNDAESLVSHLTLNPDDDDLDISLKLVQVDIYTQRLRERARRHRVVQDNQLIPQFFNKDKQKRKISREERELEDKLRLLCQDQDQSIMLGVLKQRMLSQRLAEFLRFRRNGLVMMEEVQHFVQERELKHNSRPGSAASNIQNYSVGSKKKEKSDAGSSVEESSDSEDSMEMLINAHLLSLNETQLCSALDLTPTQYISAKALMLADPQLDVEDETGLHILDHLLSSGWLASVASPSPS